MAYLAEVQLPAASKNAADGSSTPAPEYGLTMRGHLANVGNGVGGCAANMAPICPIIFWERQARKFP